MKLFFVISTFSGLVAICHGAVESPEVKLLTKLTPINNAQREYSDNAHNQGDLIASASDRTFHVTKDYGSIGRYPPGSVGGYPYHSGIIGSLHPGTSYRGSNLIPGYGSNQFTGPGGLLGGGHVGYGYYGNVGNYPGYSGYGGYGGYQGYGGYGDYGRGNIPGSYGGYGGLTNYGVGGYDDGYSGYGRGYGRYDGYDNTYDYGNGYGTNYGSTYAARSPYSPYSYRSDSYGSSLSNPSGYRGYS